MEISFYFLSLIRLDNRKKLKKFLKIILSNEGKRSATLNIVFCTDNYLLDINKKYLGHNYYTDIITFNLSEEGTEVISGEIYISSDTVRDNAKRFLTSTSRELHRVIFHGVLHLCGYKDKTKKQKMLMTEKENHYLGLYFNVSRET